MSNGRIDALKMKFLQVVIDRGDSLKGEIDRHFEVFLGLTKEAQEILQLTTDILIKLGFNSVAKPQMKQTNKSKSMFYISNPGNSLNRYVSKGNRVKKI